MAAWFAAFIREEGGDDIAKRRRITANPRISLSPFSQATAAQDLRGLTISAVSPPIVRKPNLRKGILVYPRPRWSVSLFSFRFEDRSWLRISLLKFLFHGIFSFQFHKMSSSRVKIEWDILDAETFNEKTIIVIKLSNEWNSKKCKFVGKVEVGSMRVTM